MSRPTYVALSIAASCAACATPDVRTGDEDARLRFVADPALGADVNLCFGFDAAVVVGGRLRGIEVVAPLGPVTLHHVALYATRDARYPDGPVECLVMPEGATELHVTIPGSPTLDLPEDVAIALPEGTTRLVVQAHALRAEPGAARAAEVVLRLADEERVTASWLPVAAPVPAIRPRTREVSSDVCVVSEHLHVVSTWPHMHLVGERFEGAIVRANGTREPFLVVDPWSFDEQRAYPVALRLVPGDGIETTCTWVNASDAYVLPGARVADEMCVQSMIVWPADAARCAR